MIKTLTDDDQVFFATTNMRGIVDMSQIGKVGKDHEVEMMTWEY
jgi:hypothetical protein